MDGLLRTLTRSRNAAPSPNRGSRNRSRYGDKRNGGGGGENHHGQIEIILEALARGLVAYAVQKYMKKLSGSDDKDGRHHNDRRLSTRGNSNYDSDERVRGGVPNMDMEMLEHLGKNILSKAVDRFGGGGADEEDEREGTRASAKSRGRGRERVYSQDRYAHSRERSRNRFPERSHRRGHRDGGDSGGGASGSKEEDHRRRRPHSPHDGYSSPSRHRRDEDDNAYRRRRKHGTDYAPLVESLETLSNAIISLNERQPGHADCEFYEAFSERSGKTQEAIGQVLARLREREERRQKRRDRRRS
ncbi:hypothetical protein CSUB01_00775 [Colletotrichum sublineola]|uniref:Uncharacterized protein n=1 Tax=Colletotrichum sublineola TaxID=1173701 RepID=A0A066X184_COLSU|nr:hypothetical protein CSUB01_00775 [Colletotrichum sublineola]